ncbi:hypothetical protein [Candidatus Tisiphia endosymbiont of Hybos culiciformis]|uniref:hypothetical protein n=1 Tax=Candidatus Tisiphia endosymbiont of Hybos culiciformis TaxID=3139331 RepID=UPI003CCB2067
MFIVHTETNGGKGVYALYKAMKETGHDVKIVAIPLYNGHYNVNIDMTFTAKFDSNDVLYPCGQVEPYTKCETIESYKPDYIFTQNPYHSYNGSILDPHFIPSTLKKIAKKIVYIPYGPHIFHQDQINDKGLPNSMDLVFVDSESTKDIYIKRYGFPKDRVIVSGYQTYKEVREGISSNLKKKVPETILWLPRWMLSFQFRDLFEGGSTFLNYHYFFYNYALQNPNINFIIRPHQHLFFSANSIGFLTQEEINQIFTKFRSVQNITISDSTNTSLVNDILSADIVISDGTSALAEVVVADKPIIYLSNGWNNEFNSNQLSRELKKYVYLAYNPYDIIRHIDYIRQNNYSAFYESEEKSSYFKKIKCKLFTSTCNRKGFKKILDPIKNPSKFIAEYLLYE